MTTGGVQAGRRRAGFTLIEVLLATALLAAGLALAFAAIRAATATVQRGELLSQRSERMRSVEGFLRKRIGAALPITFAADPEGGPPLRFIGEPTRIRFVADLPDYLGRGGPYLHDIGVEDEHGDARLVASFSMVLAGVTIREAAPRPPEPLLPKLESLRFRYRGLDAQGALGEWQAQWETSDRLPLQVAVEIRSADAGTWPLLIVALPQGGLVNPDAGLFR